MIETLTQLVAQVYRACDSMWRVKQAVRGGSAVSGGGVAVRARQWEPHWGAAVRARFCMQNRFVTRRKCETGQFHDPEYEHDEEAHRHRADLPVLVFHFTGRPDKAESWYESEETRKLDKAGKDGTIVKKRGLESWTKFLQLSHEVSWHLLERVSG